MIKKKINDDIKKYFYELFESNWLGENNTLCYLEDKNDLAEFIKNNFYKVDLNAIPLKKWFYVENTGSDDYPSYVISLISNKIKECVEMSQDAMRLAMLLELETKGE
jgi:hypothetical protein